MTVATNLWNAQYWRGLLGEETEEQRAARELDEDIMIQRRADEMSNYEDQDE